jgi:chorismate mutase-like protein
MSDDLQKALAGVRTEIDGIDAELLRLLNQRARCAQKVGEIKAEHGEAGHIYRPEREAQVLRRLQDANPGPLPNENITFFFREVMSACLSLEEPLGIAFLGPLGSFTGSAATKHFGHAARLLPQASIDDVFREVESGHCHEWLNHNLPGVPRISVASNSLAAQMATEEQGVAAIAGEAAAERYQLPRLVENIEDEPNNTTRFLVLGKHDAGVSGRDKTSLIMSAPNRTGALHELLLPLSSAGVSMCRLESRPARNALWEYVFYVDIEGHHDDAPIKAALAELARRAAYMKTLGSYPVAVY